MKALRLKFYNEIESLEVKLRDFDCNEYGFSSDPEALKISEEISQLEEKISQTWSK